MLNPAKMTSDSSGSYDGSSDTLDELVFDRRTSLTSSRRMMRSASSLSLLTDDYRIDRRESYMWRGLSGLTHPDDDQPHASPVSRNERIRRYFSTRVGWSRRDSSFAERGRFVYTVSQDPFSPVEISTCSTYRRDQIWSVIFWILTVFTFGIFYLLPRLAVPEWAFRLQHVPCSVTDADAVLLKTAAGGHARARLKDIRIPIDLVEEATGGDPFSCPIREKEVPRKALSLTRRLSYRLSMLGCTHQDSDLQTFKVFRWCGRAYVFVAGASEFTELSYRIERLSLCKLREEQCDGVLSERSLQLRRALYGLNAQAHNTQHRWKTSMQGVSPWC